MEKIHKKTPEFAMDSEKHSIQGVNSTNILNSSASTEADISFEGGIKKTVDRIYKMPEYNGDLIISTPTMR